MSRLGLAGQVLILLALAVLGAASALWQQQAWVWIAPEPARVGWAITLLLGYGVWVGAAWGLRWQRQRRSRQQLLDKDALWVVHASQTGHALELAQQTARSLRLAGVPVQEAALGEVDAATLQRGGRMLFVVSTTGEGDPPDAAAGFVRELLDRPLLLAQLRHAVLALGDRDYQQYCAFGRALDQWLLDCGALPLFERIEVDAGDVQALRRWQQQLHQLGGKLCEWEPLRYQEWQLRGRQLLNPGSQGEPCYDVRLTPPEAALVDWQAGDIAEIVPCQSPEAVAAFLHASGLDGATQVQVNDVTQRLDQVLTGSVLPAAQPGLQAQSLAARLQPLGHREYSIASLPQEGELRLLVRRMRRSDGSLGLASGWLAHAPLGTRIRLRVRSNPGFRPPAGAQPLILIGNGTGLAGLRALLKARVAAGHGCNWLLHGERQLAHDAFLEDELRGWMAEGGLRHLDRVFSRDGGEHRYVQERLLAHEQRLRQWVEQGASIYVCGSLAGMAPGVHAALESILGAQTVAELLEQGRYRRDVY